MSFKIVASDVHEYCVCGDHQITSKDPHLVIVNDSTMEETVVCLECFDDIIEAMESVEYAGEDEDDDSDTAEDGGDD